MYQLTVQVFSLVPDQVTRFMELYTTPEHEKRFGPVGGRFQTNCIGAERSEILLDASMLNHSCRPNLAVAENTGQRITRFRATRQIAKGEELCFSYIHARGLLPTQERQANIKKDWGFWCACPACTLSVKDTAISDARRKEIHAFTTLVSQGQLELRDRRKHFAQVGPLPGRLYHRTTPSGFD